MMLLTDRQREPRDSIVQIQWRRWPPKTHPSTCVTMPNLVVLR